MTCKRIMNSKAKQFEDEGVDLYLKAMKEAWLEYVEEQASEYFNIAIRSEDDRPYLDEIADHIMFDDFTFKDYYDWTTEEIESACDDYADMKYDEMRDMEMEDES